MDGAQTDLDSVNVDEKKKSWFHANVERNRLCELLHTVPLPRGDDCRPDTDSEKLWGT